LFFRWFLSISMIDLPQISQMRTDKIQKNYGFYL
jgi:hypothetical protein